MTDDSDSLLEPTSSSCWNPQLRKIVTVMASAGVLETGYLTYTKLAGTTQAFCGADGGCDSVLSGPYALIPFTNIPLVMLGFIAYSVVALLAFLPLTKADEDDTSNRIWLTAATTTMATFSVFLVSLIIQVLHASCPYCFFSAALSIGMAGIVWTGGGLPDEAQKDGINASVGGIVTSVLAALALFFGVDDTSTSTQFAGSPGGTTYSQTLVTSSAGKLPPSITTESTKRTIGLARDLQSLDAKMYGAFWCSHCYDQKEAFGKEAFSKIPYVECSKDGANQQNALCNKKKVPGYPTWEIAGQLYPGEQALEELEEIVKLTKKQ